MREDSTEKQPQQRREKEESRRVYLEQVSDVYNRKVSVAPSGGQMRNPGDSIQRRVSPVSSYSKLITQLCANYKHPE